MDFIGVFIEMPTYEFSLFGYFSYSYFQQVSSSVSKFYGVSISYLYFRVFSHEVHYLSMDKACIHSLFVICALFKPKFLWE